MHTVEMLEQALALARRAGYQVRQEWLGGRGGGGCELNGQKWIFLDLALGPDDQLESVLDALRHEPAVASLPTPHPLGELLGPRGSAETPAPKGAAACSLGREPQEPR